MAELTLDHIEFIAGPTAGANGLRIQPSTVLILVGPNNTGKSLALQELEDWCVGKNQADRLILRDMGVTFPSSADRALELLRVFEVDPPSGQVRTSNRIWVGQHTFRSGQIIHRDVDLEGFGGWVTHNHERHLREYLLSMYTVRLDGRTRFTLSDPKESGDLQGPPRNHLWSLFQNDAARSKVRELTEDAFSMSFVIDPTAMQQFRIRMSARPPDDELEEQALDSRARAFHGESPLISDLSDGVQAFTGLVSAVMSLPHRIMLIDEPEAFLHPPLARRLGRNLAQLSAERSANLIVATHSADFVMGCVESGTDTSIVRLTYEQGVATARNLNPESVGSIMKQPLLRSTKALQGLFHRSVIVTESDTDRAFYDEINYRLNRAGRGIDDSLFVNAQNWQTVASIVAPLRSVGVPAAAVVDLDAVVSSDSWAKLYRATDITGTAKESFAQKRAEARTLLQAVPEPGFKKTGIAGLERPDRERVRRYLNNLSSYGIFVVPVGEVEQWLAHLHVEGKKNWLIRMFDAMGSDPDHADYLDAGKYNVWGFIDRIGRWAGDPRRKGI